jgi:predicted nucleic acid-binding protein
VTFTDGPNAIVVDASVTIRFLTAEGPWPRRWVAWAEQGAMLLAPVHFRSEVANGLLRGTALASAEVPGKLRNMFRSGVDVVDRGWDGLLEAVELAQRHRLTVYDALYLHLALDLDAPLATLDRPLAAAARAEGIEVID